MTDVSTSGPKRRVSIGEMTTPRVTTRGAAGPFNLRTRSAARDMIRGMLVPPDLRCRVLGQDVVMLEWTPGSSRVALSLSERGVAVDVIGGLTNEEIARRRHVAVRTVANQVAALFKKLGVGSRAQLAARFNVTDLFR